MSVADLSLAELVACIGAFALGGLVKGVIGIALPIVALSILTTVLTVPDAVALMTMPILASNLWQGGSPIHVKPTLKRFWPLLAALLAGMILGTHLLVEIDPQTLYGLVGGFLIVLVTLLLLAPDLYVSPWEERWASPSVGFAAGLLGGLAAMFGPPIAVYFAALHLPKERYINSLGVAYFSAAVPLTLLLIGRGVLDARLLWLSAAACVPVFVGLLAGEKLRGRIDQMLFRKLVLAGLFLIGLNLMRRAIW